MLLQDDKPVCYASRALTCAESRYAPIEAEMLAVVFAFRRFYQYIYGRNVVIETDHKPLQAISTKPAPLRLQRMLLALVCEAMMLRFVTFLVVNKSLQTP